MSLSPFDQWFFAARDEENKIDGVGVPVGTTLLYKFCHNDVAAFSGACALLERAFNAGGAHAVPPNWLPTAKSINALPAPVRRYIHDLVSNADPAGTVRDLTISQDTIRELEFSNRLLRDACNEVVGCFDAAEAEGMQEALANTTDERLKDLIERRLMYALYACQSLASAPPAPQAEPAHKSWPKEYSRMVCKHCDHDRKATPEETATWHNTTAEQPARAGEQR